MLYKQTPTKVLLSTSPTRFNRQMVNGKNSFILIFCAILTALLWMLMIFYNSFFARHRPENYLSITLFESVGLFSDIKSYLLFYSGSIIYKVFTATLAFEASLLFSVLFKFYNVLLH